MNPKPTIDADKSLALKLVPVSPTALQRLEIYATLLTKWQKAINLVAPSTLATMWTRHFANSAQVLALAPRARRWADLGSGAGFPGLVLAVLLADTDSAEIHLIESDQRKAAFLREVSRETGAPAIVENGRIEEIVPQLNGIEAVTARALAPLPRLIEMAAPLLTQSAIGIFLKGQDIEKELTAIPSDSNFNLSYVASVTDRKARIVLVRAAAPSGVCPV